jgi:cation-transporting ATPase 13A3/4/5
MAIIWTVLIVGAALTVSYFQYRNETSLYKITQDVGDVRVIRDGTEKLIAHQDLVPGDVVVLDDGIAFCDMVVVATKSLLIDESALTGESNPVGKAEIDPSQGNVDYDATRHKRNTVFAGTTVLETDGTRAIVTKTASFTARGELIRDIYSYSRHQFKFDVEVPIVLTILFFYAITAFVLTNHLIGEQFVYGFFYGMYVVATILPPLLPTVFTVSVGISDERLARKRVACTNAESILVAGKVTRAFFDKTGTLTKQGLDYLSVRSASDWNKAQSFVSDQMSSGMAVCHTLIKSRSGELAGNPVDRTMFQASGAKMFGDQVTDNAGHTMKLVKQFDFDHHSMTQSTIIKTDDGRMIAYVKGSGENIKVLCKPESVPSDFDEALRDSAVQGIYQISMAMKQLPSDTDVSTLLRSDLETDLAFIGVINFKNIMREEAPDVIRQLAEGEVQSFMITGDSILTGIRIARECGIFHERETVLVGSLHSEKSFVVWKTESHEETALPSIEKMKHSRIKLALSGEALSVLLADNVSETRKLMDLIRVYGRCTPYDKVVVVSEFVKVRLLVVGRRRFHKQKVHDPSPVSVPPPAVARIHYAYDR